MPCAHPAFILAKRDIEHPVQAVFNSPVTSDQPLQEWDDRALTILRHLRCDRLLPLNGSFEADTHWQAAASRAREHMSRGALPLGADQLRR